MNHSQYHNLIFQFKNAPGPVRTGDPLLSLPHRITSASNPNDIGVASLDYVFTISGVQRIVSEDSRFNSK